MSNEVYLYTVHPKRPLKIEGVGVVRTPKTLSLTKEDVKLAIKGASVYRRFANIGINERVTTLNIDRLHRAEYISEKDWEQVKINEASEGHAEVASKPEEVKPEPAVEPTPAEESTVEEATEVVTEEESTVITEEPVVEDEAVEVAEEVVSEDSVVEEAVVDDDEEVVDVVEGEVIQNNQNHHHNKKRNRR